MKKILSIILCAVMMLGVFTACGKKEEVPKITVEDVKEDIQGVWLSEFEEVFVFFSDGVYFYGLEKNDGRMLGDTGTYKVSIGDDGTVVMETYQREGPLFIRMKNFVVTDTSFEYTDEQYGSRRKYTKATDSQEKRILDKLIK